MRGTSVLTFIFINKLPTPYVIKHEKKMYKKIVALLINLNFYNITIITLKILEIINITTLLFFCFESTQRTVIS